MKENYKKKNLKKAENEYISSILLTKRSTD